MATIKPAKDGPLMVKDVPILRDADGQNITPDTPSIALCRCGASKNKPFCDGSHKDAGFSSENPDTELRTSAISYVGEVEGHVVTVSYTPALCGHVAECVRMQGIVFDPDRKPWIQPENGTIEGICEAVAACPSGALRVGLGQATPKHIEKNDTLIAVVENGPYVVNHVKIDADPGAEGASKNEYILCRCGQSKNKPFCDGTHHDTGWKDTP
ncbi:CDGSH iron-sulfur domain-containing protein [Palleronia caenipelagi]|uniref:Iron-binding zinc finger CDGSH type domain-containing protein n=1 Tax=Palleronia caenipelagi TaxID=2489174 RepID=A0A547PXP8_9RHOB|nr:CDGSH iron-sulfur domain-containing protein [Palleronia caenipelagi]TRD18927.1 hypothetical protein FEV53_11230 [Palleronia caenipelagi]